MNLMNRIKPVPQKLVQGSENVVLGTLGTAGFRIVAKDLDGALSYFAFDMLCDKLSKKADVCAKSAEGSVAITLSVSDEIPSEVEKNANQAYSIKVSGDKADITGYGPEGLYYGVTTFLQCVEICDNVISVPEFELLDWPDLKTRGHFMECRFGSNLMKLDDWRRLLTIWLE